LLNRSRWLRDIASGEMLAWYRGDIADGKLVAYLPRAGSSTAQVKGSVFSGAGTGACTGLLTTDTITSQGTAPTCSVNGTLTISATCWDIYVHRSGVLWAYWPGINVGQATELDASGNGHHLVLTTTTIADVDDGTGTNYVNAIGYSGVDMTKLASPGGISFAGGVEQSSWGAGTTALSENRTFIQAKISRRIRQDGPITRITIRKQSASSGMLIKFKVFRDNLDGTYTMVSESEQIAVEQPLGTYTYDLASPLDAIPGDILGFWANSAVVGVVSNSDGVGAIRYTAGDITTTDAFAATVDNHGLKLEAFASTPFLAVTGDSIAEGNTQWQTHYSNGLAGDIDFEIAHRMKIILDGLNSGFGNYQNYGEGSTTFAWVASTGLPDAITTGAQCLLIHCGVNDISLGRTWAQVEANLTTIAGLITTQRLYIDEILPWTAGTDAQAEQVRLWNTNLDMWCTANGATLIRCHGRLSKIRATTGELDDLQTAFDLDGVHLTKLGVQAMAEIWMDAILEGESAILPNVGPLSLNAPVTVGTTYPAVTVQAPLGPEFQEIAEWTNNAAVDLSTFAGSNYTRFGPRGMMIYGSERTAAEIAAIDRYLGVV